MTRSADVASEADLVTPMGAILAGGRALRFGGRPKGLELVAGARIVDRVAAALRDVATDVLLIGAPQSVAATLPGCRAIPDEAPGDGPLGAIVTALRAAGGDVMVVAWDMPFVTAEVLRPLLDAPPGAHAVLWENEGFVEPLCGLYRFGALELLASAFAAGERSPRAALDRLRVHLLTCTASDATSPFTSVNTAEQLDAARRAGPQARR